MIKLPDQFGSAARNASMSAAGGGCTSCCCCCCVVSTGIASVASAIHFARLPVTEAVTDQAQQADVANASEEALPVKTAGATWGAFGFFILPATLLLTYLMWNFASALFLSFFGFLNPTFSLGLGLIAYVGLFSLAYRHLQNNWLKGVGVGLLSLVLIALAYAAEVFIWFQFIFD